MLWIDRPSQSAPLMMLHDAPVSLRLDSRAAAVQVKKAAPKQNPFSQVTALWVDMHKSVMCYNPVSAASWTAMLARGKCRF